MSTGFLLALHVKPLEHWLETPLRRPPPLAWSAAGAEGRAALHRKLAGSFLGCTLLAGALPVVHVITDGAPGPARFAILVAAFAALASLACAARALVLTRAFADAPQQRSETRLSA